MPQETSAEGLPAPNDTKKILAKRELTDEQLVVEFVAAPDKNEKAFNKLVGKHYNRLIKYAFTYLRSNAESQDAVQETFQSFFRFANNFNPSRALFRTWIDTICRNECFRIIKNRPSHKPWPKNTEEQDVELADENTAMESNSQELKEEYLDVNIIEQKERKIIELHLLDGKTYLEIQKLNLPEFKDENCDTLSIDAMEKIYNRALKKLQDYHRKKQES